MAGRVGSCDHENSFFLPVFPSAHARTFIKIIGVEIKIRKRPNYADKFRSLDSRISKICLDESPLSIQIFIEVVVRFSFKRETAERETQKRGDKVPLFSQEFWAFWSSTVPFFSGVEFLRERA